MKALDLQRDPRFALHSGSPDPDAGWKGDAKVAGRAEEITDPTRVVGDQRRARSASRTSSALDVTELVVIRLSEARDTLVIESWHEGRGVSSVSR